MTIEVRRDRDMHRAGGGWLHAGWHFSFVDTVVFVDTVLEFRPVGVWATRP